MSVSPVSPIGSLAARLLARCQGDGEFRLMARYWDGAVRVELPNGVIDLGFAQGEPSGASWAAGPGALALRAPEEVWAKLLAPVPPPMFNDIVPAAAFGFVVDGDPVTYWQYYPALRRLIELFREETNRGAL